MKNKILFAAGLFCLFLGGLHFYPSQEQEAVWTSVDAPLAESDERTDGSYFTLYDMDSNDAIEYMSRVVYEGDELITSDNRHYQIMTIDGDKAYCRYLGSGNTYSYVPVGNEEVLSVEGEKKYQAVAIYTTHSDESYVPTSGTESKKGDGDILKVAGVIAEELEKEGVEVLHSENIHDPHDVNAYQRSRKTAAQLLQGAPAAIIDVHRDGVPDPDYYATEIDGEPATQIRLVVGKQNQNSEANIEFAEKMKAYYDAEKPGLIKSIYMAKGNYNQDMAPHSVLLEVGTHTNTLEAAEKGALEFAEALPDFLGIATNEKVAEQRFIVNSDQVEAKKGMNGTTKSILLLVGLALIGGAAFMFISKGASSR